MRGDHHGLTLELKFSQSLKIYTEGNFIVGQGKEEITEFSELLC